MWATSWTSPPWDGKALKSMELMETPKMCHHLLMNTRHAWPLTSRKSSVLEALWMAWDRTRCSSSIYRIVLGNILRFLGVKMPFQSHELATQPCLSMTTRCLCLEVRMRRMKRSMIFGSWTLNRRNGSSCKSRIHLLFQGQEAVIQQCLGRNTWWSSEVSMRLPRSSTMHICTTLKRMSGSSFSARRWRHPIQDSHLHQQSLNTLSHHLPCREEAPCEGTHWTILQTWLAVHPSCRIWWEVPLVEAEIQCPWTQPPRQGPRRKTIPSQGKKWTWSRPPLWRWRLVCSSSTLILPSMSWRRWRRRSHCIACQAKIFSASATRASIREPRTWCNATGPCLVTATQASYSTSTLWCLEGIATTCPSMICSCSIYRQSWTRDSNEKALVGKPY